MNLLNVFVATGHARDHGSPVPICAFFADLHPSDSPVATAGNRRRSDMACPPGIRLNCREKSGYDPTRILPAEFTETEMKELNSNKVSEFDFFTVCFTPRFFGAGTSEAARSKHLGEHGRETEKAENAHHVGHRGENDRCGLCGVLAHGREHHRNCGPGNARDHHG